MGFGIDFILLLVFFFVVWDTNFFIFIGCDFLFNDFFCSSQDRKRLGMANNSFSGSHQLYLIENPYNFRF